MHIQQAAAHTVTSPCSTAVIEAVTGVIVIRVITGVTTIINNSIIYYLRWS